MKVTLKDIAKIAGVSKTTVSLILNNQTKGTFISEVTRRRVFEIARKLNYKPNYLAKALVTGKSWVVGIVTARFEHIFVSHYSSHVMRGIASVTNSTGYNLMLLSEEVVLEKWGGGASLGKNLSAYIDGMLILGQDQPDSLVVKVIEGVKARRIPFVYVWRGISGIEAPCVRVDNLEGSKIGIEYLLNLGHRRIGVITLGESSLSSQERLEGYRNALKTHDIPFDSKLIKHNRHHAVYLGKWHEETEGIIDEFLKMDDPPTAIFALYDPIAVSTIKILWAKGKRIPQDISVMGFGDTLIASYCQPELTTLSEPMDEIGKVAATLLIDNLEHQEEPFERSEIMLKPELVVRSSCARIK